MKPKHTGIWGQTLIESLRKQGISDHQIVGNTGINIRALEGEKPKIEFEHLAAFFERAAELTGDDLIGFKHGQGRNFRLGGLIAYTGASSPTVRTLLHNLARYQRTASDAIKINASRLNEEGIVEWHFLVERSIVRRQYVEFDGAGILDIIRRLTNRHVTPLRVEFRHFRSTNLKPISKFFGCPVDFGRDENRITMKLADLDLPLKSADDHLYKMLRQFSEEALSKLGRNKSSIETMVDQCISADPTKSQADVAKEMGMSARTLARRLTDAGTTFFSIVETHREAMAKSMLADTDMQFTEVAYVLGYNDPSTFSTAFKRWVGATPTQYRNRNAR
ncbi:AraC family transcriptional regulator [Tateyamaria sp.]|uniref:AraC family transcriptional regulator n=1 Tax=Tateyamaria sp. TaxID=1929288 RepID=UPI00329E0EE4